MLDMEKKLTSQDIAQWMRTHESPESMEQPVEIRVVKETGSTNADLLALLPTLSGPVLLIAENQTAGKGRAGRIWHSAPGTSLTFSLAWPFKRPMHALVGLPLAVGVAVSNALEKMKVKATLKWPNDLLLDGKKLGGILIETAPAASTLPDGNWAVIGVGLNLAVDAELAEKIARPIADAPVLTELDPNRLMAALLDELMDTTAHFERDGFTRYRARWNTLHAYADQHVAILDNGKVMHEGKARGVDTMGRFMLDTAQGQIAVLAGDISLRALGG